jgi:hypothetical protein
MGWIGRKLWGWYRLWGMAKSDLAPGMQTVECRSTSPTPRTWRLCRGTQGPTGKQIPSAHFAPYSPHHLKILPWRYSRGISKGLRSRARGKVGWFGEQTDKAHRYAPPLGALSFLLSRIHTQLTRAPGSHPPNFQCLSGMGV